MQSKSFIPILVGSALCAVVAFLSYRFFFRGDVDFFLELVVLLPLSFIATTLGSMAVIGFLVSLFNRKPILDALGATIFGGIIGLVGVSGLSSLWIAWRPLTLGIWRWRDVFSFPYILAITTLVPATLSLAAFATMLIAKLLAEPARVFPEAYMTFIKEEVGGTQASGAILLLGMVVGVVVGVIWGT